MSFSFPNTFKNVGHFVAATAKRLVSVTASFEKFVSAASDYKPEVEALATVITPQGKKVADAAYAALGVFAQALEDTNSAVATGLLDAHADSSVKADILSVIALLKQPAVLLK